MTGMFKALATAVVLAALAGGIWAGVRPKPEERPGLVARSEPMEPREAVATPARTPSLPRTLPQPAERPASVAQPAAKPKPSDVAAPRFADHRNVVERPVAAFIDERPLSKDEPGRDTALLAPGGRFEDRRQLLGSPMPPSVTTARTDAAQSCGAVDVSSEPRDGGRMLLRVSSPCRAGRSLSLAYGGAVLARRFDQAGRLDLTLDLFAGALPATVTLHDGTRLEIPTSARDLDHLDKVAIVWSARVNLDLHAFEYGAETGASGHVSPVRAGSAGAARELTLASGRGRGFISLADDGDGPGDKVEVYTYFRAESGSPGPVRVVVENVTRGLARAGAHCGEGSVAPVAFESITLSQGQLERMTGEISPQACGRAIDEARRFTPLPQQTVRR